jgi:antitoxin VapB
VGLSIKNEEVERMIRELASRRGVPTTEALRQLLAEEAERQAERKARYDAAMAIAARVAAMPDISDITDDEILGYDENGVPSR